MIKQIRQNVFETNSSSTHSICIAKNIELALPTSVNFVFGEYGWENNTLDTMYEKASYLYTGLYSTKRQEDIDKITKVLEDNNIETNFEKPIVELRSYKNSSGDLIEYETCNNSGYVDHSYELGEFLDAVCNNKETLFNYLFSPLSFIITGNDNEDSDTNIEVNYEHDKFYKGN